MKKFKNKKVATIIAVFLMVFVMAGAFASFQAVLRINARVNLYTPTVDALIATFTVYEQPILGDSSNPRFRPPGDPRFPDRVAPFEMLPPPAGRFPAGQFDAAGQGFGFFWANPVTGDSTAIGATGVAGTPPLAMDVQSAGISNPRDFQAVYLTVNFDNFTQRYEFRYRLANVGVLDLEVEEVVIELVSDPESDAFWNHMYESINAQVPGTNVAYTARAAFTLAPANFFTIGGTWPSLNGAALVAETTAGNFDNYSDEVSLYFEVTMATWNAWLAALGTATGHPPNTPAYDAAVEAALIYFEDNPFSLTFRIRHVVVPDL